MSEKTSSLYVVGIGASAGGLDAVTQLLSHLPADAPVALVLIQHLDRDHPSELAELLNRASKMPVSWITDHTPIKPGFVYVLPPGRQAVVRDGSLVLSPRKEAAVSSTIDDFFLSLAEDCREHAVAVILSGSGSDGAAGVRAVKAAGGLVFVQNESTAAFPGMGRAAIQGGDVDQILSPARIAEELLKLTEHTSLVLATLSPKDGDGQPADADTWSSIFRLIAARKGVDFSDYKQSTIMRRLVRRMVLTKTDRLSDYLKRLQSNRVEVEQLYQSLLINVTSFFRDPECFDHLRDEILPRILEAHSDGSPIRVWIPGCSTGEEAYTIAVLLTELLEDTDRPSPVQIFGTDISEDAIAFARAGIYPASELQNVEPDRLHRHFSESPRGYVVKKAIREMCVFARQNVTKDSPFSRLDLISCRNLLIYLGANLQRKLMPTFHYALNPGGYLMLGTSESVGAHVDLFRLVDRRFRIYSRKSASRRMSFDFAQLAANHEVPVSKPLIKMPDEPNDSFDAMREADRVVLGRHGPPGVLVNEELEILQFRGKVSPYLEPVPGRASLSLLKMAVDGLAAELEAAVNEAKSKNVRIMRNGITLMRGDEPVHLDLDVTPIDAAQAKERFYLILFVPRDSAGAAAAAAPRPRGSKAKTIAAYLAQIEQLKQDLEASRNYLQSTIEKFEVANQELRAANEEIQSSNEELQSTNEELETAKEELQSSNEELTTVNEELHSRQNELIQVNNDLNNLINSVHLPIIILGQDMRIRRFTPMAERVLNVIPTDIGRPLSDININLNVSGLPRMIGEVMESLTIREMEVQNDRGRWYSMRLRPYKTAENKIEGVVMTLIDIDDMKRTIAELENTRIFAFAVGETIPDALVAMKNDGEVYVTNEAFHQLFGVARESARGRLFFDLLPALRNVAELKSALDNVAEKGEVLSNFAVPMTLPLLGRRTVTINARHIVGPMSNTPVVLVSFHAAED